MAVPHSQEQLWEWEWQVGWGHPRASHGVWDWAAMGTPKKKQQMGKAPQGQEAAAAAGLVRSLSASVCSMRGQDELVGQGMAGPAGMGKVGYLRNVQKQNPLGKELRVFRGVGQQGPLPKEQ